MFFSIYANVEILSSTAKSFINKENRLGDKEGSCDSNILCGPHILKLIGRSYA